MEDHIFEECYEAYLNAIPGKLFWGELAEKFGYDSNEKLRKSVQRERKKRGLPLKEDSAWIEDDSIEMKEDSSGVMIHILKKIVKATKAKNKSPDELMQIMGYDISLWKVIRSKVTFWTGQRSNKLGGGVQPLASVHLEVSPISIDKEPLSDIFDSIKDVVSSLSFESVDATKPSGSVVSHVCIADFHIGSEPFYEKDYDYINKVKFMMSSIFSRIKENDCGHDHIVLDFKGDYLHYDTRKRTTTSGTQLTYSMKPLDMFSGGLNLAIWMVQQALTIAPVKIYSTKGNHASLLGQAMMVALEQVFSNNKDVKFFIDDTSRKWFNVGVNLIGLMHGHGVADSRNKSLLINDAKAVLKDISFAIVLAAHLHSPKSNGIPGVEYYTVSSPAPTDEWHHEKGFEYVKRGVEVFMWKPNHIGIYNHFFTHI